jgi:hypothetical protein
VCAERWSGARKKSKKKGSGPKAGSGGAGTKGASADKAKGLYHCRYCQFTAKTQTQVGVVCTVLDL